MKKYKYSILVSNILDPLTHDTNDLKAVYDRLSSIKEYKSIETRLIRDEDLIDFYNLALGDRQTTYWITGELQRENLNLSSIDNEQRKKAVSKVLNMLKIAKKTHCHYIGIASGKIEKDVSEGLKAFVHSMNEILSEMKMNYNDMKVIVEPLDQFAHKKNVVGTTKTTLQFLEEVDQIHIQEGRLRICWDSAHVALNRDEFEESIKQLAPYIERVHLSNAVLDPNSNLYGDHHLSFCEEGFLNKESAKKIIEIMDKYLDDNITVALEIRVKHRDEAWDMESQARQFLNEVIQ